MNVLVGAPPGQCATSDTLTDRVRRVQRSARTVQNDTASHLAGLQVDHWMEAGPGENHSEGLGMCWEGGRLGC